MSAELFLEIGTEEIPAGFLPQAQADLERLMRRELDQGLITYGSMRTFATPRRIALSVQDVATGQERQELNVSGPSVKVAFDAEGNPTKAAIGFARSQGVDVSELSRAQTDKGEYVYISKVIEGRATAELLPEMLPRIIGAIPFRKSMRWKDLDTRFVRPMHWIVALFDGAVVPFTFAELASGNTSRGHRFMAPQEFTVGGGENYLAECERHFVIPEPARRREIIAREVKRLAEAEGGQVNLDEDLLNEVTYLVEYPVPIGGGFEEKYLELPRELLITSMREHQRYFTLVDQKGELLPKFITVANTRPQDPAVVARGNERVLRARLADAMFFWREDQKIKLESRLESLKSVVYQARLGTSYAKVMRFQTLAVELAEMFAPADKDLTARAALLAKCDLETGMVNEFPELQGIMGREYARLEGEDPRVARAIHEHYLPTQAGGELPAENIGAFVSIADKLDTICGCFGVGLIPTGTADPFALRRSAIGVLNIVLDRKLRLSLPNLIGRGLELLGDKLNRPAPEVKAEVVEFFRARFFNMLTSQGYPQDVVDAVLSASFSDPVDALTRVQALSAFKKREDFEQLAVTFKRVVNIIKGGVSESVDPAVFEHDSERRLHAARQEVQASVAQSVDAGAYEEALHAIAGLREPVDAFFDSVMVMAEDSRVRTNRLALLTGVARLFEGIADFSRLAE